MTRAAATNVKSGLHTEEFASRRTLVMRRFRRNQSAVVSLTLLILLFAGCYLLPPLLPYSYTDLDYTAYPIATRDNTEEDFQLTEEARFASSKAAPIRVSPSRVARSTQFSAHPAPVPPG